MTELPSFSVADEVALVTGASSGIGLHLAEILALAGAKVALAARRTDRLEEACGKIRERGGVCLPVALDVTSRDSIVAALDAVESGLGGLSVLVNNAGVVVSKPFFEHTEEDWDHVVDTNLKGAWLTAREFAHHLVERKRPGRIINIASVLSFRTIARVPSYLAAKAGLLHLNNAMAMELARYNILVNAIAPGYVVTDFNRDFLMSEAGQKLAARVPMKRVGQVEDLGGALLFLASPASAYITGACLSVDGGHGVAAILEAGLGDRQAALAAFLQAASGAGAVEITRLGLLGGGAIQENWGIDASIDGGRLAGSQRLVLRTDAATGVPSSLGRIEEFAVLKAAFAAGVTVPEPLFACADKSVIGKPFFVMRRMAGSAAGRPITLDPTLEAARPAIAERLGQELARIQAINPPRDDLAFLLPYDGPIAPIAEFRAYLDRHPNPRPVLEWALRWAETHLPEKLPPVLCHRDFRTGNYLLDGTRLTAILDWEFAGWGDPDEDIGWLCCKGWRFGRLDREAGGIGARAPLYRGYEAESGRLLDPERVKFWEVYANIRWAIIALQQSDRYLLGRARNLSTAITGRRATECELELLMLLDPAGASEWIAADA